MNTTRPPPKRKAGDGGKDATDNGRNRNRTTGHGRRRTQKEPTKEKRM